MKILMILDEEFPPDVRVEKEALSLIGAKHEVHIICYTRKADKFYEEWNGIIVHRLAINNTLYRLKALALLLPQYFSFWKKKIEELLKKENFQILHLHDLTLIKPVLELGQKYKLAVIGDYHENRPEIMKMYHHVNTFPGNILISSSQWEKYQRIYTPALSRLILVTEEAKQDYLHRYELQASKITVVPNFPVLKALLSIRIDGKIIKRFKNKFMLVYFGDTGLRRGTKTLLDVAWKLRNNPRFHFVIIGTSREQRLLEKQKKEKRLDNVDLMGFVPTEKAVSYIAASRAGVCPFLRNRHHDTTFANKLFQYMAFKKPVIVSDCPAQVNVVNNNNCGLIFKAGNPNELEKRIHQLTNREFYQGLSENAFKAVRERYNYAQSEKALLKMYKELENEIA